MPIEVDQSNKVERTERDTVLALSNDEQRAIVIPAQVKREAIQRLRERKSGKMINLHLFAAGLFILLHPYLEGLSESVEPIIVDIEYQGHEDKIKGMFLRHVHAAGFRLPKEMLGFARVGKGSNAHRVAWQVQRGKRAPDHYVSLSELLATVKVTVQPPLPGRERVGVRVALKPKNGASVQDFASQRRTTLPLPLPRREG